ncbi:hypothetical protein JVT61DRAFT_1404 [Boletus reticuloceps]|uniref:Uncharacterized protein n=1 Tax=Boletus reticuloceps TaxID=495285 RepID=A0A8I2YC15_9AGAM|nr:hypothetical protein JVT61DRAFT_1404 [Boletus reticuloceps]
MIRQYLHIQRAKEELERCNVEVQRLLTAILAENEKFDCVITDLTNSRSPLLPIAMEFLTHRRHINSQVLCRIKEMHGLEGFSGKPFPGVCAGAGGEVAHRPEMMDSTLSEMGADTAEEDKGSDDVEMAAVDVLVDYVLELALSHG